MKKITLSFLVVTIIVFYTIYSSWVSKQTGTKDILSDKNKPFEEFYLERSYPDSFMDYKEYNRVLKDIKYSTQSRVNKSGINSNWTLEGPTNIGGRINAIEVDPNNSQTIYVGAAAGGVFKTTNGGVSWSSITEDFAYLAISDITIDPNSSSVIYVGTGDLNIWSLPHIGNGVYKSIDKGNTWVHKGLAKECIISRIVVDPIKSNIVYAAAMGKPFVRNNDRGLYKSIDGGDNWSQILFLSNETGVIDMVMDPFNSNILYCSGWDRIRNEQESVLSGDGSRIWKTTDGGLNWTKLTGGLPDVKLSRIGLTISEKTPNLLFASVVGTTSNLRDIYKSEDAGLNWESISTTSLDPNSMGGFGWYFGQIRVSPYDDDQLNILGVELYSTFTGGDLWSKTVPDWQTYEVHADCHDLVYIDSTTILLATDGGLYKTTDRMLNWTDIEDLPNTQFYRIAVNPHRTGIYSGGAQDNGTTSGNASNINSWPREFGGDGFQTLYHPTNPNLRYVEVQSGGLYYSDNAGLNFSIFNNGIDPTDRTNWNTPFVMSSFDASTLYTGTFRVYKQTGAPYDSWIPISNDLTNGLNPDRPNNNTITTIAESPINHQYLYAGTSDGNVWNNLGTNWTKITNGLPNRYVKSIQASPSDSNTVFVVHSGYRSNVFIPHVHKSVDNGLNWIDISGDLPQMAVNDILIYPNSMDSVIFVATDAGVYLTSNSGKKWSRIGKNMPLIPVFDIDIDLVNNKLVAGTFARSIQSFPIDSLLPRSVVSTQDIIGLQHVNLFPNPANSVIHIDNLLDKTEVVIYNLIGKVEKQIRSVDKRIKIDVSDFKSGGYLVFVKNEKGSKVFKMLKD